MTRAIRGNSLYTIVDGPSWTQAEVNAIGIGGHLITIESLQENQFLTSTFSIDGVWNQWHGAGTPNAQEQPYWIGLTDQEIEGTWRWSSGSSSTFTFWEDWRSIGGDLSPNGGRSENYAYIGGVSSGAWDDAPNLHPGQGSYGIAEIPLTSSITFSTAPKEGAGVFTTSINLSAGNQTTDNLANGATVFWTVSGITADDLASGALIGSGTITNGKLDLQHSLKIDADTEEQFWVSLFSDSAKTQQIGTTTSVGIQESGPIIRGNSFYCTVDGSSWTRAEANATELGGHLVAINSEAENSFLLKGAQRAINSLNGDGFYWLGANDLDDDDIYTWSSGDPLSYASWFANEPSGSDIFGTENYGFTINFQDADPSDWQNGYWYDTTLDGNGLINKGIAEIPFVRRGDSAYVIVQGPTWEEAEANANKLGGHLATINDAAENEWLAETYGYLRDVKSGISSAQGEIWVGLRKDQGVWNWANGDVLDYTNWGPNEPNNNAGIEDRAHMSFDSGKFDWNDNIGGQQYFGGIAEIKLAPNNNPTGTPSLSGTFRAGQFITINSTSIQDADNFTGYTPTYNYSWEVSTNGSTWSRLTTTDATDNNSTYTLTTAEVGKQIRGVVSYLDGYGTQESIQSRTSIQITPNNRRPQNISASLSRFDENILAGSTVALLGTTHPDASNTFRYSLVTGQGSTDNRFFRIQGNNLKIVGSPDFEAKRTYSIRVRTTDQGGLSFEKSLTFAVNNLNETPANIGASATRFNENIAAGSTVATLNSADPDVGNTFIYTLVGGTGSTDNSAFRITGNQLKINTSPDFETQHSYSIRIRTTDQGGRFYEKSLNFQVDDLIEKVVANASRALTSDKDILELTGNRNIFGTGNQRNNTIIGNSGNNKLTGGRGKDTITGGAGTDTYFYSARNESLLSGYDVITDYANGELIATAFEIETNLLTESTGQITSLTTPLVAQLLTSTIFTPYSTNAFTVQGLGGTFVAINDGSAGFQANSDAIIHLSNYNLSALSSISIV